jgi:hypothetical protein
VFSKPEEEVALIGGAAPRRTRTIELAGPPGSGDKDLGIHSGFYFGQTPGSGPPDEVIARDAQGRILARSFPSREAGPPAPPPPVVREERTAVELTTRDGRKASLAVGWGEGGGCVTWHFAGLPRGKEEDCGSPTPLPARGLLAWTRQVGSGRKRAVFLTGRTGPEVSAIRLRFEDGTTVPVEFRMRVFLNEVQPRNYVKGHRPQLVLGLDGKGRVIARTRLAYAP